MESTLLEPTSYTVWLEVVKTVGIITTALIGIWTLKTTLRAKTTNEATNKTGLETKAIAEETHKVSNSRLSEMIEKVDELTKRLATSEAKEQATQARLDDA